MICTPSPQKPSWAPHHTSAAATPTRVPHHSSPPPTSSMVASPGFLNLHSPLKSPIPRSTRFSAPVFNKTDDRASSSDDLNSSDEDDGDEDDYTQCNRAFSLSPTTPAPRKSSSSLMLSKFSAVRRHPNQRISNAKLATPSRPIPPPRFNATPRAAPRTPDKADEWHVRGAESMTRLSLHDTRKDHLQENIQPTSRSDGSSTGNERKRTGSTNSYLPARYRKNSSPPNPIGQEDSPTARASAALFQSPTPGFSVPRRATKSPEPGSPTSPFGRAARFPPLHLLDHLSQETAPVHPSSSPRDLFPLLNTAYPSSPFNPAFTVGSSSRPSSSKSNPSLSTSTSTNSNTSLDGSLPVPSATRKSRLARKFKPKAGPSGNGSEDSDAGSGLGDVSFGSSSSLGPSGEISPLVVTADDEPPFPLVTPMEPSPSSGWPTKGLWGDSKSSENIGKIGEVALDADELLFHMARTANEAGQANAKKVMPDTPMKRHPPKPRVWQSTGKSWTMGPSVDFNGTIKGVPRKSLPLRLSNFVPTPDSPESDPSPSKPPHAFLSRPSLPARRKSHGAMPSSPIPEDTSPIPALPISVGSQASQESPTAKAAVGSALRRAELLRRTSSGAQSTNSEPTSEGSLTPTRSSIAPSGWKASPLVLQSSADSLASQDTVVPSSRLVPPTPAPSSSTSSSMMPPPSPFVLPRAAVATAGPVKTFLNSRPSLALHAAGTPLRAPARRESNPVLRGPPIAGLGWGTPVSSSSSRHHGSPLLGPGDGKTQRRSSGAIGLGLEAIRRPRSTSRLSTTRERPGPTSPQLVEEIPGKFEQDFVRPAEGTGAFGKGTFGQVFKVRRKGSSDEKMYAIKRSKQYDGERHRARLLEEVEVLRHLTRVAGPCKSTPSTHRTTQGHDNVLHYIDAWEQDSTLFIQTELCELGNFADFLLEYGKTYDRLDESRLWKIKSEIAAGLHHVHHNGVIHLDLKPANIFVTIEGRLRIGDFGMATRWPREDASSPRGGSFEREGDREYLAAEILVGKYGPEADIFSFGMIMLEAASNAVIPSNGDSWHELRHDDFSEVSLEGLSDVMVRSITSMMASDYSKRPTIDAINSSEPIVRARAIMKRNRLGIREGSGKMFRASAFATESPSFLVEVLGGDPASPNPATLLLAGDDMDTSF